MRKYRLLKFLDHYFTPIRVIGIIFFIVWVGVYLMALALGGLFK